jgi:hypothetical protein
MAEKLGLEKEIRGYIQRFPDWSPGARTANGTGLYHYVQLYRHFVSQASEFCLYNPLCCCSTSVCCCYFVMTQSGNFWIHPRRLRCLRTGCSTDYFDLRELKWQKAEGSEWEAS